MIRPVPLFLLTALALLVGCGDAHHRVNGAVNVPAGEKGGDVATVNGAVRIGEGASVAGVNTVNGQIDLGPKVTATSVHTVNGAISIGEAAQVADEAATVNGAISLGKTARVGGDLAAVNGSMTLSEGADVAGRITNVNGLIRLVAAHVGGVITTVRGDIDVGANSRVEGGILVKKPGEGFPINQPKVPRIVIGPGAVVQGTLKFEHEVKLYVSDTATVGPVEGATATAFSGDRPAD